jgi:hypothetical protein
MIHTLEERHRKSIIGFAIIYYIIHSLIFMYIASACRPDRRWFRYRLATTAFHSELALFLPDTETGSVHSTPSTVPHPSPRNSKRNFRSLAFLYASNNSHDATKRQYSTSSRKGIAAEHDLSLIDALLANTRENTVNRILIS